jgi:demethylmenaquinone methyltransferase/2-methoxy-6-polyprenyl-1,4-benzoquinol methylase
MVANAGLSRQITFREGDVKHLPFDENTFDLVWSADCVGHPAGELAPSLRELMRVVKPGGSINLLGWWSQQLLPGHTLIEARLNATCLGYLTFFKDKVPETNFLRVPHWFHHAGLRDIPAPAFVSDIHAPLGTSLRIFLILLLDMRWATPQAETSQADWNPFRRLCDSASSDFVLDAADYCGFFTYTIFRGKVTKE